MQLTATAKVDRSGLEVRYTARNDTPDTVLLLNRIERWDDAGQVVHDDRFYTVLAAEDLRLTVAYVAVPEHVDVESPDVPLVTRVAPGASFSGVLRAASPLEPYHPYPGVVAWADPPRTYDRVFLVLGWLVERPGVVTEEKTSDGRVLLHVDHTVAARSQELAVTRLPLSLEAHVKPAR